jgi:hypothetical protein
VWQRVAQSPDQVSQLLVEARSARTDSQRNFLFTMAAQKAHQEGDLRRAVDIMPNITADSTGGWRDQTLRQIVGNAITARDTELANLAVSRMLSPLNRAAGMRRVALYYFESGDVARAREVLSEAFRIIDSSPTSAQKAGALQDIAVAFARVDEMRVTSTIQSAVSVINSIPSSNEERGSEARNQFIKNVSMPIVWNTHLVFRALARINPDETLNIADSFRRRDIRLAALIGASTTLLRQNRDAQSNSRTNDGN